MVKGRRNPVLRSDAAVALTTLSVAVEGAHSEFASTYKHEITSHQSH